MRGDACAATHTRTRTRRARVHAYAGLVFLRRDMASAEMPAAMADEMSTATFGMVCIDAGIAHSVSRRHLPLVGEVGPISMQP
jgi:hypothetical protein